MLISCTPRDTSPLWCSSPKGIISPVKSRENFRKSLIEEHFIKYLTSTLQKLEKMGMRKNKEIEKTSIDWRTSKKHVN